MGRWPIETPRAGGVVWLNTPPCQGGDHGFESRPARQFLFRATATQHKWHVALFYKEYVEYLLKIDSSTFDNTYRPVLLNVEQQQVKTPGGLIWKMDLVRPFELAFAQRGIFYNDSLST